MAEAFDKIRINPGNFADGRKVFKEKTYEKPEDYQAELDYIEETFTPLVLLPLPPLAVPVGLIRLYAYRETFAPLEGA